MTNLFLQTSVDNNRLNLQLHTKEQNVSFNPDHRILDETGREQKKGIALTHGISGIFQRLFGKTERIIVEMEQEDGSRERKVFRVNKNSLNKYLKQASTDVFMQKTTEDIVPEKSAKTVKATVLSLREKFSRQNPVAVQPSEEYFEMIKRETGESVFHQNSIHSRNNELEQIKESCRVAKVLNNKEQNNQLNECLKAIRYDVFSNEGVEEVFQDAEEDIFYDAKEPEIYSFDEGFPSEAYVREVRDGQIPKDTLRKNALSFIEKLGRLTLERKRLLSLDARTSPERGTKAVTQDAEFFYREAPNLEESKKLIQIFKDLKKKEEEQKEINRRESENINGPSLAKRLLERIIPLRWL